MKKNLLFITTFVFSLCMFIFSSCKKDDPNDNAKPVINLTEVGAENSKTVTAGSDLHLEGEIIAESLIKRIDIEIHQKKGGNFKITQSFTDGKYIGVKNVKFHEHIDIPADAPSGEYHLHFTVTDQLGQTEMKESELMIKEASKHITVKDLKFGASHDFPDNKIGYIGTKPLVSAHITAENGLDKIVVHIHNEEGTPAFEVDTTFTFEGEKEWGINGQHKHIAISDKAPVGEYHMHVNVYDKQGEVSEHAIEGVMFKKSDATLSDIEIGTKHSAVASDIMTKFNVKAEGNIHSIRMRIYKEDAPKEYFYNHTLKEEFANKELKEYAFNQKLEAKSDDGKYAPAGEYILEIRIEY
ncbi:MAG: DUF4625 domain-containing protein, partial [Phocaeicola sp.]